MLLPELLCTTRFVNLLVDHLPDIMLCPLIDKKDQKFE